MLLVDLREVQRGPVETAAALPPGDPAFEGLELELDGPVAVDGKLQATGPDEYFWRGHLRGVVRCACRRCLSELRHQVDSDVDALFSADPAAADDPEVYPLPESGTQLDLRPVVREELALAVPAFPLCREECAGLCPQCGADLNAGPCACSGPTESH